jgi:hypothetical protein
VSEEELQGATGAQQEEPFKLEGSGGSEERSDHEDMEEMKTKTKEQSDAGVIAVLRPSPYFVMKTKRVDDGAKVFVNVCTVREIEQHEMDGQGNNAQSGISESVSVSGSSSDYTLHVSGVYGSTDRKSGEECLVCDVVLAWNVLEFVEADEDKESAQHMVRTLHAFE